MFLIDITFKGSQEGHSNRSSIVHAVSYFACSGNDTACTVYAGGINDTACILNFFLHTNAVLLMILTFRRCSKIFLCMRCQ
jgi:hypothetical protein